MWTTLIHLSALLFVHSVSSQESVNVRGAGASFPSPVYFKWISLYKTLRWTHVKFNMSYEAVGSGSGKKQIMEEPTSLEYAGSDSLLKDEDYKEHLSIQMYPVIAGWVDLVATFRANLVSRNSPIRISTLGGSY
jgi:ABC-type phosphate transport system substrate-binding protein